MSTAHTSKEKFPSINQPL